MYNSFADWIRRPGGRAITVGDPECSSYDILFTKSVAANRDARYAQLWAAYELAVAQGQTHKVWVASNDGKTRSGHRAAHGQVQRINDPFIVDGESLFLPSDPKGSWGETANCRCTVRYIRQPSDTTSPVTFSPESVAITAPYLSPSNLLPDLLEAAWRSSLPFSATVDGIRAALRSDFRLMALDILVGGPLRTAEAIMDMGSYYSPGPARLLREFRLAEGPQTRQFGPNDPFTVGFVKSETTQTRVQRALADWKSRKTGLFGQGGTYVDYRATFVPLGPGNADAGVAVTIIGTPEAHVIGSFTLSGHLISNDTIEWSAANTMSLKSYFAENWTRRIGVSLVDNNLRPQRYGNTRQTIIWRTDLDGRRIP